MIKILVALFVLFCITTTSSLVNAEIYLTYKSGKEVPQDIVSSSYRSNDGIDINLSKYLNFDDLSLKPSYFISAFFYKNAYELNSNINKRDSTNFTFYDKDNNVKYSKSFTVANKGLSGNTFWLSIIPDDDFGNYMCESYRLSIASGKHVQVELTDQQFAEWKQVAGTVTNVKVK